MLPVTADVTFSATDVKLSAANWIFSVTSKETFSAAEVRLLAAKCMFSATNEDTFSAAEVMFEAAYWMLSLTSELTFSVASNNAQLALIKSIKEDGRELKVFLLTFYVRIDQKRCYIFQYRRVIFITGFSIFRNG